MLDESLQPSPEAEAILRTVEWSPEREMDIREWVETLRADGNEVFPHAEAILKSFGGLRLRHKGFGGLSLKDFELDPVYWYYEREHIADLEGVIGHRICPLGIAIGAAMLAVLEDGGIIGEMDGTVVLFAQDWRSALDHLILGKGKSIPLADDYEPVTDAPPLS